MCAVVPEIVLEHGVSEGRSREWKTSCNAGGSGEQILAWSANCVRSIIFLFGNVSQFIGVKNYYRISRKRGSMFS